MEVIFVLQNLHSDQHQWVAPILCIVFLNINRNVAEKFSSIAFCPTTRSVFQRAALPAVSSLWLLHFSHYDPFTKLLWVLEYMSMNECATVLCISAGPRAFPIFHVPFKCRSMSTQNSEIRISSTEYILTCHGSLHISWT